MEGDFQTGQLVLSLAGRDAGRHFLVLKLDGQRVVVADGELRKVARPKCKNRRHLYPYHVVDEDAVRRLDGGEPLRDAEIKAILVGLLEKGGRESE